MTDALTCSLHSVSLGKFVHVGIIFRCSRTQILGKLCSSGFILFLNKYSALSQSKIVLNFKNLNV